jgi:hypothetical protein
MSMLSVPTTFRFFCSLESYQAIPPRTLPSDVRRFSLRGWTGALRTLVEPRVGERP